MIRVVKLFLCIIILFCGAAAGLHLSRRLIRRRDVLSGFEVMFHRALIQIEYNAGDLCEAFSDNFAQISFRHDLPFDEQWKSFVNSFSGVLTKEDISLLLDFLRDLGTADSESQRRHIAMYSKLIQEQINSAKEDIQIKSKMYRIVPLSAGIMISLLLI